MSDTEQELAPRLEPGMQIGDYYLQELTFEDENTRSWYANQVSVSREVIIDSLNRCVQQDENVVSTFLSDVRTKAKVDHPLIGSVFEAVREENICFYAREKLSGDTLADLIASGRKFIPEEVAHILKQIAEANLYLESHRVATLPIAEDQVYVSNTGMCRLINMAVGGERDYEVSTLDKHMLANAFMKLIDRDQPGATRTQSLLDYMVDLEREIPLTWEQIRDLSAGVERQLTEPTEPLIESHTMAIKSGSVSKQRTLGIGIAIGLLIACGLGFLLFSGEKQQKRTELKDEVSIAEGEYYNYSNEKTLLSAYQIDAHEVTIAEYAIFLEKFNRLTSNADAYEHEDQPEYKTGHEPNDWEAMYAAAKSGSTWNGLKMSLNCPVVGVDWWDAYTFAAFDNRRLPTQEEWYASIQASKMKPIDLPVSSWGPVDQKSPDLTSNGIYGLAGNVSEWSLKMTRPLHDPTTIERKPVICGGSFADKSVGASYREWLDPEPGMPDARDIRRINLGFRTVSQPD